MKEITKVGISIGVISALAFVGAVLLFYSFSIEAKGYFGMLCAMIGLSFIIIAIIVSVIVSRVIFTSREN